MISIYFLIKKIFEIKISDENNLMKHFDDGSSDKVNNN